MNDLVIEMQGLTQEYDGRRVLDQITTSAHRGQVIGLVGLNGAGKTTLLETMLGYAPPTQGTVQVLGVTGEELGRSGAGTQIGFVPQQDELLSAYKGAEYLNLVASFYSNWHPETVERLVSEWAIPTDRRINNMSLGERQKLSIISALGHHPELVVLDEPVASLDPLARRQFLQEIVAVAADQNATVLFSTHIITDLERIAERIWLLQEGKLVVDSPLDELKESHSASLEEYFLEMHA